MGVFPTSLRQLVIQRADNRCEYCGLSQLGQQNWQEHFFWKGVEIVGLTAVGHATIHALKLNRATIQAIRIEEEFFGRHPPL